jgi:hypothetical protein
LSMNRERWQAVGGETNDGINLLEFFAQPRPGSTLACATPSSSKRRGTRRLAP